MSAESRFWVMVAVLAVGTWAMRSLPIMLHGTVRTPPWLERLLRHVPVAALTALAVPGSLFVRSDAAYAFAPARLAAAVAALVVALRTRSVAWTLIAGMAVLWVTQYTIGALT